MSLQRIGGLLGLAVLVAVTSFLLYVMVRMADTAYARQRAGAAAERSSAPASAAWRQDLFFDHAAAPQGVLGEGWAPPEAGSGVWSSARHAVLRLPPSPAAGDADVTLTVEAFVAPARPFQRVIARSGARTLGEWRLTTAGASTLHFRAPLAGGLELQLDLPDAASPSKLVRDAMDPRTLAIKLQRITVTG